MKRLLMDKLIAWKKSKRRKPLILWGARQVGKTWLMKEFGKKQFDNYVYISFYNNNSHSIDSYVIKLENNSFKVIYTSDIVVSSFFLVNSIVYSFSVPSSAKIFNVNITTLSVA